jgi:ParB family transcriptional regulator, chromosome partitioning protein
MGKAETLAQAHKEQMLEDTGVRPGPEADVGTRGQYEGFTRLAGAGMMDIENLIPDPDQIRTEFDPDELGRLAESIKHHGILAPLRVRWDPGLGKHYIVVGERRYQAALKAGLTRVPVIIVEGEVSPKDVLESQIAENCIRSDISPIDQANAFQKYMSLTGCTAKDLAGYLHVSQPTVGRALALLQLPVEVQAAVSTGEISPTAGAEIAKIKNPEVAKRVARKAAETKAPVAEVEKQVRQKRGTPAKVQAQPFTQFKVRRGCRIVIHGKLTGREIVEALEAATGMARAALEDDERDEQYNDEEREEQGE